jgi:hypothetical protein
MEPKLEQCLGAYIVAGVATGLLIGALTHSDVWAPTGIPRRSPEPPTPGCPVRWRGPRRDRRPDFLLTSFDEGTFMMASRSLRKEAAKLRTRGSPMKGASA